MAKAVQRMMSQPDSGLHTTVPPLRSPEEAAKASTGTGSDDIGDVTWNVPSVTLYYPANIPGTPGHNWADAIAMATPIAHKGVVAGAKVQAMTLLDLMLQPKARRRREALLHRRADEDGEVSPAHGAERSAGDLAERGEDGAVPRRDAEVLLRSDEVRRRTCSSSASRTRPSRRCRES